MKDQVPLRVFSLKKVHKRSFHCNCKGNELKSQCQIMCCFGIKLVPHSHAHKTRSWYFLSLRPQSFLYGSFPQEVRPSWRYFLGSQARHATQNSVPQAYKGRGNDKLLAQEDSTGWGPAMEQHPIQGLGKLPFSPSHAKEIEFFIYKQFA